MTDGRSDGELLASYLSGGAAAERAFAGVAARHGAMVHRTCLRVPGRKDLAEEAAQAC